MTSRFLLAAALAATAGAGGAQEQPDGPDFIMRSDPGALQVDTFATRPTTIEDIESFNAAHRDVLPLTPGQAAALQRDRDLLMRALQERPPISTLVDARSVTLDASQPPPDLLLHPGVVSNLNFIDRTGAPWPVAGWMVGDNRIVDVLSLPRPEQQETSPVAGVAPVATEPAGETGQVPETLHPHLAIAPRQLAGWSNLLVFLQDSPTPVNITLRITHNVAHYRLDLIVLADGPNARGTPEGPLGTLRPGNRNLVGFLSLAGIPEDAEPIAVSGVDGVRAWSWQDSTLIRTRHTLMSPRWSDAVRGTADTRVYRLDHHPPVLLVAVDGRPTRATLSINRRGEPDPDPGGVPAPVDP